MPFLKFLLTFTQLWNFYARLRATIQNAAKTSDIANRTASLKLNETNTRSQCTFDGLHYSLKRKI